MYLFDFSNYWGIDKIVYAEISQKYKNGDLIKSDNGYYLIIGEKIHFENLYKHQKELKNIKLAHKNFLGEKTIKFIHRMVKQYFTTYRKVLLLFLNTFDIEKILKYKIKSQKVCKQKLVLFPDIWTAYNFLLNENFYHGGNTIIQKIKLFWNIKSGKQKLLIATHSVMFQDWKNIENIQVYFPHRRYYKNQQNPRYHAAEVAQQIAKIYDANIEFINDLRLIF